MQLWLLQPCQRSIDELQRRIRHLWKIPAHRYYLCTPTKTQCQSHRKVSDLACPAAPVYVRLRLPGGARDHLWPDGASQAFPCAPGFRILAAQNPLQEGGGRRGLPKSFLNRFSKVAVEAYSAADFRFITGALFPQLTQTLVRRMIAFTTDLLRATMEERTSLT